MMNLHICNILMNSSNELKMVGEGGVLAKKILTEKEFSFKGL